MNSKIPNGDPASNIKEAALEWAERNRLMDHTDFQALKDNIARDETGRKAGGQKLALEGRPEELGQLAAEYDLGIAQVGDEVNMGHLRGIRVVDTKVAPVLVCINRQLYQGLGTTFTDIIADAQPAGDGGLALADGAGLHSPGHTSETPPSNLTGDDRWFAMRLYNGQKVPVAPWIDENPDGEPTSWNQPVGHNWDGVKTDYETAKDWVEKIDGWFLATRIGDFEEKSEPRLHLLDFDNVRDPETGEVHPRVAQILDFLDTYAQVSYSGTGVHAYAAGPVPAEFKETGWAAQLGGWTHEDKFEGPPELECYARKRFIAITEKHIENTPEAVGERAAELGWLYGCYGEEDDGDTPTEYEPTHEREPEYTRTEIRTTDKTDDWDAIFDAIAHAEPRFAHGNVRLQSEVTNERTSGIFDLDPYWEHSESGSRLGYDDGFIYRKGDTGLDILQVVALEERIISTPREYPEGGDWFDAVDALRERGAHIPEYEGGEDRPDPMSILPLARLDALSHTERRRYAKKRGIDWPDVETVRTRLEQSIIDAVENDDYTVKSAPTAAGKTHTVATEPWKAMQDVTDNQPVVHTHRTHEARDQARAMSDEEGVEAKTLKGRTELCPVARGDHDPDNTLGNPGITVEGEPISDWIDHKCDRQGLPFSHVHRWAEDALGAELPCQRGGEQCAALGQFEDIPRDSSGDPTYDVIHCTQQFLHVPSLRMHTHVFIDEKPSFGIDIEPQRVHEAVNAYLEYVDAPVDSYSELVTAARTGKDPDAPESGTIGGLTVREHNDSFRKELEESLNGEDERVECPECGGEGEIHDGRGDMADLTAYPEHGGAKASTTCPECNGYETVVENRGGPPLEWYRDNPDAHSMAPAFARAVWQAEESAGDRKFAQVSYRPPRWGNDDHDEQGWNRVYVDVVLNDQWEVVEAEAVPDFSLANTVVGLDAHPQPEDPLWRANAHPEMETCYTLDTTERTLYRRYERGLYTVQLGEGVQPVASGEWLSEGQGDKFAVIIEHLTRHYEDFDAAITSLSAKQFVRETMEGAGVEEPDLMHYGEEESRNDFAGKEVGLVAGSIDPGDNMIVNLCARLGLDVDPAHVECPVCDGRGNTHEDGESEWCQTCSGSGEVRERGRTFVGEDADHADAVLRGVREHHVAQSAGRWARDADDPDDHAIVFIITEAAPDGFIDAQAPGATWVTNDEQRERLEYVRDNAEGVTCKEVAEACDCAKETARRTLQKAASEGIIERTPGVGPYGADVYAPDGCITPDGTADFGSTASGVRVPKNGTDDVWDNYTWSVAIDALPNCAFNPPDGEDRTWEHQSTVGWYERAAAPPG